MKIPRDMMPLRILWAKDEFCVPVYYALLFVYVLALPSICFADISEGLIIYIWLLLLYLLVFVFLSTMGGNWGIYMRWQRLSAMHNPWFGRVIHFCQVGFIIYFFRLPSRMFRTFSHLFVFEHIFFKFCVT